MNTRTVVEKLNDGHLVVTKEVLRGVSGNAHDRRQANMSTQATREHRVFGTVTVKPSGLSSEARHFLALHGTIIKADFERPTSSLNVVYDAVCADGTKRVLLTKDAYWTGKLLQNSNQ